MSLTFPVPSVEFCKVVYLFFSIKWSVELRTARIVKVRSVYLGTSALESCVDNPTKETSNVVEKMTGDGEYNFLTGSRSLVCPDRCPDAQHRVPVDQR